MAEKYKVLIGFNYKDHRADVGDEITWVPTRLVSQWESKGLIVKDGKVE